MSYLLTFQGSSATQALVGLVETQDQQANVSAQTIAPVNATSGLTVNTPFVGATAAATPNTQVNYQTEMPELIPQAVGVWGSFDAPTATGTSTQNSFGGWLAFVGTFSSGTSWPLYGVNESTVTPPLGTCTKTFNGHTFNFLFTSPYDTTQLPASLYGVEAIPTGTIAGDLAVIKTFFDMVAANYNIFNCAPYASVAAFEASGPTINSFGDFPGTSWYTTAISGDSLVITMNSNWPQVLPATTLGGGGGGIGGGGFGGGGGSYGGGLGSSPGYPYMMLGSAPNITLNGTTDSIGGQQNGSGPVNIWGDENSSYEVLNGAGTPGDPAFAFLTGVLFDSNGIPQTQGAGSQGSVSSAAAGDKNHVHIDSTTNTNMLNAGFYQGIPNIQLTWLPMLINPTIAVTIKCTGNTSTTYLLSDSSVHALKVAGITGGAVQVTITDGVDNGHNLPLLSSTIDLYCPQQELALLLVQPQQSQPM
jgi:hypothetical protein